MRTARGEKEKLRERILIEAIPFLKELGREGAPVDQIMKKVGLTSGALYSHFKSKDDFFAEVVKRELEIVQAKYAAEVEKNGAEALKKIIKNYLSEDHVESVEIGCVFVALGADMRRNSDAARADYEERIEETFRTLAKALPKGSEEERVETMRFIFSSMVGALTYARTMKNKSSSRKMLNATKSRLLEIVGG